ncbi:MAG: Hsp20/alpha crystallin family protein [Clostridiales bacterium]|jgi:HSP20 family molecular chaperone IbpA|nr:Hsp20/alpha crystallin family protein [Clostridiales bacterium]
MLLPSIFKSNFDDFFNGFDDMFNFPSITRIPASRWMTTNVKDLGSDYELEIELPGYDKKDISATLDKGYLTISAKREETKDGDSQDGKYIRRERYSGSCKRSFYVGDNLKEKDFKASFENGILNITFPKDDNQVAKQDEKKYITIK